MNLHLVNLARAENQILGTTGKLMSDEFIYFQQFAGVWLSESRFPMHEQPIGTRERLGHYCDKKSRTLS
jgi:hypothetical protein